MGGQSPPDQGWSPRPLEKDRKWPTASSATSPSAPPRTSRASSRRSGEHVFITARRYVKDTWLSDEVSQRDFLVLERATWPAENMRSGLAVLTKLTISIALAYPTRALHQRQH